MVAFEHFDETTQDSSDINVNDRPTQELQDAIIDYQNTRNEYHDQITDKINELKSITDGDDMISTQNLWDTQNTFKGSLSTDDGQDFGGHTSINDQNKTPLSRGTLEKGITDLISTTNSNLRQKLKHIQLLSQRNVSNINSNINNIRKTLNKDNQNTGISDKEQNTLTNPSDTNTMTNQADTYKSQLANQRGQQKKILQDINMHDGEYDDTVLQRKSYRFQSIIFSVIFLIVTGLIVRAVLTKESNSIETLILFLGIALALYYLIDYFFNKY